MDNRFSFDPKAARFAALDFQFSRELPLYCNASVVTESGSWYHVHPGIEVGTCLNGEGYYYLGGGFHRMEKGDSYFFDSLIPHANVLDEGKTVEEISVHYSLDVVFSATQFRGDTRLFEPFVAIRSGFSPVLKQNRLVASLIGEINRVYEERGHLWDLIAWTLTVRVLTEIARVCLPLIHSREPSGSVRRHGAVTRAVAFINDHATQDWRIEHLAAHCAMSPSRLTHLFTEYMRVSPVRYRNELRVGLAVSRLCSSRDKITAVALDCGYNSFSQFMETFKKITGQTPGAVRRSARARKQAAGKTAADTTS